MDKANESIIKETLAYIRANLSKEDLSVEEIARKSGYSGSWLRAIFRKTTGIGVLPHLLQLRLEKAKELLRDTDLDITAIAFDVGYRSYTHFAKTFRKKAGVSPSAFRLAIRRTRDIPVLFSPHLALPEEPKEWLIDNFAGNSLREWWQPLHGEWQLENGAVLGKAIEDSALALKRPLPENFTISFETQFASEENTAISDLLISLRDEQSNIKYCEFAIGARGNMQGELRRMGTVIQWNQKATIKKDEWQCFCVELKEDRLRLLMNDKEMFYFRDSFPPSYASRCKFSIGGWSTRFKLRNFTVYDLGILTQVPASRQGDMLFNAGLFDQARDFYTRRLQAGPAFGNIMELRFKIGMCFLRQGSFSHARSWMDKVVDSGGDDFWAQQAAIVNLESDWREENFETFLKNLSCFLKKSSLRNNAKATANMAMYNFASRGFHEKNIAISQSLLEAEEKNSVQEFEARYSLAGSLQKLSRFAEAENILRDIIAAKDAPPSLIISALHSLTDAYILQGNIKEGMENIEAIRAKTKDDFNLAYCCYNQGILLRGTEHFGEAIRSFQEAGLRYPKARTWGAFSEMQIALIVCMLGKTAKAKEIMNQMINKFSDESYIKKGKTGYFTYVPWLLEGEYIKASALLLADSKIEDDGIAGCAAQAIKAGILLELAEKQKEAGSLWMETMKRFPAHRCCYYASLAQGLFSGETGCLEKMPYHTRTRSEMFYLVGLLYEKRGNLKQAQKLFEMSWKEDPTLRWPAYLSKRKLERK